jgi:methyltransferase (TIGR00027 family)
MEMNIHPFDLKSAGNSTWDLLGSWNEEKTIINRLASRSHLINGEVIVSNQAAQTAYGPMSIVAAEQSYAEGQRLVRDELASQFLPFGLKVLAKFTQWPPMRDLIFSASEKRAPGVWGGVLCRKRYIDDKLMEDLKSGIAALVILGAGLDTHAYREAALGKLPVYEVDLPENIDYKRAMLLCVYGKVPENVTLVGLDFNEQDLGSVLASHGCQAMQKSFFIWEAVTQYLTGEGIRKTFRFLSQVERGSRLVFTYVRQDFIDGTNRYGLEALYQGFRVKHQVWQFGMEPGKVGPFLQEFGWKEQEQMGSREFEERYVKPAGRRLPITEVERVVLAEKL